MALGSGRVFLVLSGLGRRIGPGRAGVYGLFLLVRALSQGRNGWLRPRSRFENLGHFSGALRRGSDNPEGYVSED